MTACNHRYHDCPEHPGYKRCVNCGTFRSQVAPPPQEIYTADYWTEARGHSEFRDQVYNCDTHEENGVSKNAFICSLVQTEGRTAALDIGCAPGALLRRLKHDLGFVMVDGVEVPTAWDADISEVAGCRVDMWHGVFPNQPAKLAAGWYDLITAIDVFEHSHEPEAFLAECARLLKPGGQLILMTPLWYPRVPDLPDRMWQADEHVYIHSVDNAVAMLADAGFDPHPHGHFFYGRWCPGHEVLSARKIEPINYDEDGEGNCLPCP